MLTVPRLCIFNQRAASRRAPYPAAVGAWADPVRVFLCHAPRHIQPARAGPSRPASEKASNYWIRTTTRAAAGRAGIVTGPCTCSCSRVSWHAKKQSGLTLHQVTETLDAVPILFRNLQRDERRMSAEVLDRWQGRVARNAAAARAHERRRWAEHPLWLLVAVIAVTVTAQEGSVRGHHVQVAP